MCRRSQGLEVSVFDAHCDTALKILDDGVDFANGSRAADVDLPRLRAAGVRAQVFACFVLSERYPGEEADRAERLIGALDRSLSASGGRIRVARTKGDLREGFDERGPIAAIVGLEGADPLEGNPENLRRYYDLGVRDLILAWKDNPFSGASLGHGRPLTDRGRRLLGLCEDLGVMVDVSHLSDTAFAEIARTSKRPFIASHSNCRALCASPRNLTDEMIRSLADSGGVMGITFATGFLALRTAAAWSEIRKSVLAEGLGWREADRRAEEIARSVPRPSIDWIVRHVFHAIDVGGTDSVGLGSDFDGILHRPAGIDGVQDVPRVVEALRSAGLSESQVEKVCFENFRRAFEDVLPD